MSIFRLSQFDERQFHCRARWFFFFFLTPDDFSSLCDQTQLADIDLHHCSFGDDAQGGVEGRGGVLLHAEDGEAEGGLQLWVCDVSLFETQALRWSKTRWLKSVTSVKISEKNMRWSYHRSDKTLVFGRFPGEAVADEANLGDHSLPGLLLSLSCFDDFEHFGFSLGTHFGQRHLPFTLQGEKMWIEFQTLNNHSITITDLNCGVFKKTFGYGPQHLSTIWALYNVQLCCLTTSYHKLPYIFSRKTWNIPVVKVESRWRHLQPSPSSSVWSCWKGL